MKTRQLYFFLIATLVIRLVLAAVIPVFGDEAYYYIWSRHLQLSYFDHPPMVSWFIALSHLVLPGGNPVSLRISFVLASFLVSVVWIKILKLKQFNEPAILSVLILLFLNPLLGIGSILATPDTPLVLFWTLAYYCYLNLFSSKKLIWYSLLGIFLGLGFCAKYHIVLFVLGGLIYLVFSKKFRLLRPKGVLLTLAFGALFSMPVVLWNAQNQWSSFLFQINHGFGESTFEWAWPLGYLIAQFIIINPIIFFSLFKKGSSLVEKSFSLSQLVFFFASSFKGVVEGNWPLTSHLHSITHFIDVHTKKLFRYSVIYWFVFYLAIGTFFLSPASRAVKKNLVNSAQLNELVALTDQFMPLYGPSYQVASLLSWKSQKNIPKLNGLSRHDFYDSLPESIPAAKTFFVLKYDNSIWPENYSRYKKIKIQSFDNLSLALYQFTYE